MLEKLAGGSRGVAGGKMIVLRFVEVLLVVIMNEPVVLRSCYLEVGDPGQLAVDVSLIPAERRPLRHPRAADCVLLIGVESLLGPDGDDRLDLGGLAEQLLPICSA